jgi:hypothetical protein
MNDRWRSWAEQLKAWAMAIGSFLAFLSPVAALFLLGYLADRHGEVAELTDYLENIRDQNYPAAYDKLCDSAKTGVSRQEYGQRFPPPRIVSFVIADTTFTKVAGEEGHDVDVDVRLDDGQTRTETYFVFNKASDVDRYYVCPRAGSG